MSDEVKCPRCDSVTLHLLKTKDLQRSEDTDNEAIEKFICLDCEQSLIVTYNLELLLVEED
jgi:hypothetical protein